MKKYLKEIIINIIDVVLSVMIGMLFLLLNPKDLKVNIIPSIIISILSFLLIRGIFEGYRSKNLLHFSNLYFELRDELEDKKYYTFFNDFPIKICKEKIRASKKIRMSLLFSSKFISSNVADLKYFLNNKKHEITFIAVNYNNSELIEYCNMKNNQKEKEIEIKITNQINILKKISETLGKKCGKIEYYLTDYIPTQSNIIFDDASALYTFYSSNNIIYEMFPVLQIDNSYKEKSLFGFISKDFDDTKSDTKKTFLKYSNR